MTKDEIIEMARKAGGIDLTNAIANVPIWVGTGTSDFLDDFAKLVSEKTIKEALAQLEQEPVAWMIWGKNNVPSLTFKKPSDKYVFDSLYTTPSKHKPLSDEQIEEIAEGYLVDYRIPAGCAWNFARDIEAAHGIKDKNTREKE
jgi:hypothetical protein